jgi:hypothetical protein
MRDLVESGFRVCSKDATAAPILPGLNGLKQLSELSNDCSHVFTTKRL